MSCALRRTAVPRGFLHAAAAFLAPLLFTLTACERPAGDIDDERMLAADREPGNWLLHGGNLAEQHYSSLTGIHDGNVASLGPAWFFEFDTSRGQQSTPIVVDGVMYVTTAMSKVYAIRAATGELLWRHDPEVPGDSAWRSCCDVTNRGAAVYKGRVYVAALDGRLIALDAASGEEAWSVETVDRDSMYTITGAPRVVRDKVIIGNSGGDFGVRGYVSAYDAASGALVWRFYLVPGDPAKGPDNAASDPVMETLVRPTWSGDRYWRYGGGATAWNDMTYDPDFDLLYVGTGNGSPWNREYRSEGKGDNLFVASIVALDPDTGAYAWHYQQNPGESWDYNSVQPIVLADLVIDGTPRKALLHAPKNGFFYVLDRATGKLISAESYLPTTWASSIDVATGRPVEAPNARYENSPFRTVTSAHSWYPFSYSRQTGLVYFPVLASATEFRKDEDFRFVEGVPNRGAIARSFLPLVDGAPPTAREFLLAWDPARQKEAWRADGTGFGVLATGGNLVFQGHAREGVMGRLTAHAADTGRELWSYDTPNAILPGPISYSVDGEQYVAVVSGARIFTGFGPARVPQNGRVVAFKLGGTAKLPPDPDLASPIRSPEGEWPAEAVAAGERQYVFLCERCHGHQALNLNVIPDLRRSVMLSNEAAWKAVVLEGALIGKGMRGWRPLLDETGAENIRAYVAGQARKAVEAEAARRAPISR
jgi:quinohemoprotein ethanol dehydrogenase